MNCPANPPPPVGYHVWRKAVPTPLAQWAVDLIHHVNKFDYDTVWSLDYGGQTVLARKDYHTWTYRNGELVSGICIPGITLYEPDATTQSAATTTAATATATATDDLTTPDPNAAVFSADPEADNTGDRPPNWGLILISGAAAAGVVWLFTAGLKHAGRATARR